MFVDGTLNALEVARSENLKRLQIGDEEGVARGRRLTERWEVGEINRHVG